MRSVDSKIYNKDYYLNSCLGFEEFKKFKGKKIHKRGEQFLNLLKIKPGMQILDIGCGRGDLAIECSRRGAKTVGIDYSEDAINLAKSTLNQQKENIRKKLRFIRMDTKKLEFSDNSFDLITSYDVFEHLYKEELELALTEISRVLKPDGILLVHTETNKIYLDFTHRVWSRPLDHFLIKINSLLCNKDYSGLQKDPRNDLHKMQHVNEPTYTYLNSLFKRHKFSGKIFPIVPLKPIFSWKDTLHNIIVSLYPVSFFFPFHLLFAHEYICIMRNNKLNL